jgi:hypothetical protein
LLVIIKQDDFLSTLQDIATLSQEDSSSILFDINTLPHEDSVHEKDASEDDGIEINDSSTLFQEVRASSKESQTRAY